MYQLLLRTPFSTFLILYQDIFVIVLGVFCGTGTPDPISNSVVKCSSANGISIFERE